MAHTHTPKSCHAMPCPSNEIKEKELWRLKGTLEGVG
jgi:hypothetical protein